MRVLANAVGVWLAAVIVPGVILGGGGIRAGVLTVVAVGAIFGVVNAVLKPVLTLLTFPLFVLTLGLFALVLNALLLWLTGAVAGTLGLAFDVQGFWSAVGGGLVVSLVSVGAGLLRQ